MKIIKICGLMIMAMVLSSRVFAQADTKEQLVVPLSEPGKPYKLQVDLMSGSIKIIAYEGKDIVIDAQSENSNDNNNDDEKAESNGMKRIGKSGINLEAEEKNNRVTVHSQNMQKSISLILKIPQGVSSLKLSSLMRGDIEVSNINSEMEINNMNGGIELKNVSGSVVANTINGNIIVTFKSVDNNAPMAFSTLNGKVDVSFPADFKANLKLKSDRGEMFTDFDIAIDKSQPKVNRSSESGMYRLTIEDWIYGKINGGGPEMLMKNMMGNIYIRKSK